MGVAEQLGYEMGDANAVQRAMQKVASSKPGAWMFQKTLYPLDKALFKWTGGKTTVPGMLAGLQVIMLTTTGAKSGEPRTMPLLGIPIDGDLAVIGSNFGQGPTPGWVYNLEADPHASVAFRDVTADVVAERADDATADRVFEIGAVAYGGYTKYRERADHREIRVFLLKPAD